MTGQTKMPAAQRKLRDFSEMSDEALRALADDMLAIERGGKLKDVLARRRAGRAALQGEER